MMKEKGSQFLGTGKSFHIEKHRVCRVGEMLLHAYVGEPRIDPHLL